MRGLSISEVERFLAPQLDAPTIKLKRDSTAQADNFAGVKLKGKSVGLLQSE
jgi:hypothetical protein